MKIKMKKNPLHEPIKLYHVILTIIAGLLIAYIMNNIFFQFRNHGKSMLPTLNPEELIIVNAYSYWIDSPERGDLVVFLAPNNMDTYYVKRVIGLPGEAIWIKDGVVNIFNEEHPEGWLIPEDIYLDPDKQATRALINRDKEVIPEGMYYVLGDNRSNSEDSRFFGPVPKDLIKGKAWYKIWWPYKLENPFEHPLQ